MPENTPPSYQEWVLLLSEHDVGRPKKKATVKKKVAKKKAASPRQPFIKKKTGNAAQRSVKQLSNNALLDEIEALHSRVQTLGRQVSGNGTAIMSAQRALSEEVAELTKKVTRIDRKFNKTVKAVENMEKTFQDMVTLMLAGKDPAIKNRIRIKRGKQ